MTYQTQELSFAYSRTRVLDRISLDIDAGEFVSLVGPNGAGKSTLLRLLVGLLDGYDGSIRFQGRPLAEYDPRKLARKIAFVPQETHVVFPFTAAEMIRMGRHAHRRSCLFDSPEDSRATREAMARTGTSDLANRLFNQLSGGERQRVVLASALVQEPEVLLLDEPTVYLDLKHQLDFYELLANLNRNGLTVVAITHDLNLAARYAGRMIALRNGRIAKDGTPRQVITPKMLEEVFEVQAEILNRPEGGAYVIPRA